MNNGEVCLIAFTNSLAATNILVVGDNIGAIWYQDVWHNNRESVLHTGRCFLLAKIVAYVVTCFFGVWGT